MSKKKGKYFKQQQNYFKRTNKGPISPEEFAKYTKQITANKYILVNPKFDINVVYGLLNVHNKINAGMIIRGTEKDFEDNPNEVYRVVHEKKTLTLMNKQE